LALEGKEAGYFPVEKHGVPDYYELVLITSDATLRKKREMATRFVSAVDEAIQFAKRNPEEALAIYFQANPNVRKELDARAFRDTLKVFATTQVQSLEKWKGFLDFALDKGLIQTRPSPESLFENVVR
jgi:putative hydroxymethylpyrimidine transport system substrate-binding protein